jgi:hypothetical protein
VQRFRLVEKFRQSGWKIYLKRTVQPALQRARSSVSRGTAPSKTWIKVKNPKAVREAVELQRMKKKLQAQVDGR